MSRLKLALCVALLGVVVTTAVAVAGGRSSLRADLNGYNEMPLTLSTPGNGSFHAAIKRSEQTISYRLTYADTEGTVQQAHIHFGREFVNGGVSAFLCSNLGNGPAGTQACPRGTRHGDRQDRAGGRDRPGRPGNRRRRVRRARRRDALRGDLRERPHDARTRAARSAARSAATIAAATTRTDGDDTGDPLTDQTVRAAGGPPAPWFEAL